jgi:hypothetical protein
MGRRCTGVTTTDNALKISIKDLKSRGLLAKGKCIVSTLTWSIKTDNIASVQYFKPINDQAIHLCYKTRGKEYNCKIDLIEIDSNLGKGKILYFICPVTNTRCRYLYFINDSALFQSKLGLNGLIYYSSQLTCKSDRINEKYWRIINQIVAKKNIRKIYAGRYTKEFLKVQLLENRQFQLDKLRWIEFRQSIKYC